MKVKNSSISEMYTALENVNKDFENNVDFNRLEVKGNYIHFTLKVKNSKKAGAKIGFTGRRTISACWHVHGFFFESLLAINNNAIITSSVQKDKIFMNKFGNIENNWIDFNAGSIMHPVMISEMCECE